MDESGIRLLMEGLGLSRIIRSGVEWIQCRCPFPDNHKHGDKSPSFAVHISPTGRSKWVCFTCQRKGPLYKLPDLITGRTGQVFSKEVHELAKQDGRINNVQMMKDLESSTFWAAPKSIGGVTVNAKKLKKLDPEDSYRVLPESTLNPFKNHTLESMMYLTKKRGLSQDTIAKWELGWNKVDRRLVIPIRDSNQDLVAYSGRALDKDKKPKYRHCKGFKRDYVLYGEHLRDPEVRRCFVLEGFFHVVWMAQCGYVNPLAIMGTYLSEIQKMKIKKWFDEAVVIADGDDPGRQMAESVKDALVPDVKVHVLYSAETLDVADYPEEDLAKLVMT